MTAKTRPVLATTIQMKARRPTKTPSKESANFAMVTNIEIKIANANNSFDVPNAVPMVSFASKSYIIQCIPLKLYLNLFCNHYLTDFKNLLVRTVGIVFKSAFTDSLVTNPIDE